MFLLSAPCFIRLHDYPIVLGVHSILLSDHRILHDDCSVMPLFMPFCLLIDNLFLNFPK